MRTSVLRDTEQKFSKLLNISITKSVIFKVLQVQPGNVFNKISVIIFLIFTTCTCVRGPCSFGSTEFLILGNTNSDIFTNLIRAFYRMSWLVFAFPNTSKQVLLCRLWYFMFYANLCPFRKCLK